MKPSNRIKEKYNNIAQNYALREERTYWLRNHTQTAFNYLSNNNIDVVIDIGCGAGACIRKLSKYFNNVKFIGIDFSEEMIRIAKHCSANTENIEWLELDVSENSLIVLNLIKQYSSVLMTAMGPLEYYDENDTLSKTLSECVKQIRRGGFICTFLNQELIGRSFINRIHKGKKYWALDKAIHLFNTSGDLAQVRYFSNILLDPINGIRNIDLLLIFGDKIVSHIPQIAAKRFCTNFEILIQKNAN